MNTSKSDLPSYNQWRSSNGEGFSLFDFLRGVIVTGAIEPDPLIAFWKLLLPDLVEHEGMVFLQENFRWERYRTLRDEGRSPHQIEYWMNLLGISTLLEGLPIDRVEELSRDIVFCWRARLAEKFPDRCFQVEICEDDGDTFVVFYQVS